MSYYIDHQIAELLGLAKGIVCDGVLNDAEMVAIRRWFGKNRGEPRVPSTMVRLDEATSLSV